MNEAGQDLVEGVKAAAAEAGMTLTDTEVYRTLGEAVLGCTALWHLDEDELVQIGDGLSSVLRAAGLRGAALDAALHDTFLPAIKAIDAARRKDWTRRQRIKVVK